MLPTFRRLASLAAVMSLVTACTLAAAGSGTLGGRQKCWDSHDARIPSLMRGELKLETIGYSKLKVPDDDDLSLRFGSMFVDLVDGDLVLRDMRGNTVAADDEDVTVFGGIGDDETMVVCDIEERH